MHCFRRAPSRLLGSGSALSSQSISVARSRCNAARHFIPRLSPRSPHLATLQVRWNSNQNDASPSPGRKEQKSQDIEAQDKEPEVAKQPQHISSSHADQHKLEEKAPQATEIKFPPNETVYMGNLFYDVTAEDLRKHMEKYGTVLNTMIAHDNRGLSKGFGYVQFNNLEEATAAIEDMHSTIFEGRQVVMHYARANFNYRTVSLPPTETLFIGGLPLEMTDRDLQELFRDVKDLTDIRIPVDRRSGMPRGFAHVEFIDAEAAAQGMEILQRKRPYGRKMQVNFAERKRVGMMKPRPEPVDRDQARAEAKAKRKEMERKEAEEAEKGLEDDVESAEGAKVEDQTPVEEKKA